MRHRMRGRHLNRTSSHRAAMRRNLACNLFLHESIQTTPAKAKEVRGFVEKLVSLARVDSVANFRRALSLLDDKFVVRKLFKEIGPRYRERPGGYTRILKLGPSSSRLGDNAAQVIFQLVEETEGDHEAKGEDHKKTVRDRLRRFSRKKGEAADKEAPSDETESDADGKPDEAEEPVEAAAEEALAEDVEAESDATEESEEKAEEPK